MEKCKICNKRKATQKAPYEGMCSKCSIAKEGISEHLNRAFSEISKDEKDNLTDRYKANMLNMLAEDYEYFADREEQQKK